MPVSVAAGWQRPRDCSRGQPANSEHECEIVITMSALGQKQTFAMQTVMSVLPPESGHSLAAPLRPNKGVNVLASEYDPNQLTISHFAHALLPANIVACAGT